MGAHYGRYRTLVNGKFSPSPGPVKPEITHPAATFKKTSYFNARTRGRLWVLWVMSRKSTEKTAKTAHFSLAKAGAVGHDEQMRITRNSNGRIRHG